MKFTYAPYKLYMHLDPFSGPKSDVFWNPESIKMGSETSSKTTIFSVSLSVRFLFRFGTPWGAIWVPKWDAKTCTSRPLAPWDASWRRLGELQAALWHLKGSWDGFGPLPGSHLGSLASILDPQGIDFGHSGASSGRISFQFGSPLSAET